MIIAALTQTNVVVQSFEGNSGQAGEVAWALLSKWGFDQDEIIETLGFILTDKFPDGSITNAHTEAISHVLTIHNLFWVYRVEPSILTTPLGIGPFFGRDLKNAILAGGNEWGLELAHKLLLWLCCDGEWPFE